MFAIKRQNVTERCRMICADYNESSVCRFADNNDLLGFIDTSPERNGTRGIAFSDSGVYMKFDGDALGILYKNIKSVHVISSFEDSFADELSIVYSDKKIRISDFSLDKSELKKLIDGLCADAQAEERPTVREKPYSFDSAEDFPLQSAQDQAAVFESAADKDISDDLNDLNKDSTDSANEFAADDYDIFDNEIPPIFRHQDDFVDIIFEDRAPVVTETILPPSGTRARVIETQDLTQMMPENSISSIYNDQSAAQQPKADDPDELYEDEAAERTRIQNMSPEETLSFLAKSMSEINSPLPEPVPQPRKPERDTRSSEIRNRESAPSAGSQIKAQSPSNQTNQTPIRANPEQHTVVREDKQPALPTIPLTEEPIWGDIYIKASRNLRELCESGRLSMDQIEKELDSRLLDSAKAFAEIIADEAKVPKVLIPKITELKATAKNFDQYFQMGEDIAVRAMFFMMYQMLSYADRIVETPETKERLNDFFRRFGSAGITLSMLDMRV